jgi:DNA-binding response OmpR family regulator
MSNTHRTIAKRVALLEDEPDQSELLMSWLAAAGHCCQLFRHGKTLLSSVGRESYDLLILDWNLPDIGGDEVLTQVRGKLDWPIPILFTTSRDSEADIVYALERGADDYLVKPIRRLEFLARVGALIRRGTVAHEQLARLDFGPFQIDLGHRSIRLHDEAIELTDKEYDLAVFLFQNPGRLLSRGHVLESVWGRNPDLDTRTVDVHISRIRRKLQFGRDCGWRLAAVYQHGYRLEPTQEEQAPTVAALA